MKIFSDYFGYNMDLTSLLNTHFWNLMWWTIQAVHCYCLQQLHKYDFEMVDYVVQTICQMIFHLCTYLCYSDWVFNLILDVLNLCNLFIILRYLDFILFSNHLKTLAQHTCSKDNIQLTLLLLQCWYFALISKAVCFSSGICVIMKIAMLQLLITKNWLSYWMSLISKWDMQENQSPVPSIHLSQKEDIISCLDMCPVHIQSWCYNDAYWGCCLMVYITLPNTSKEQYCLVVNTLVQFLFWLANRLWCHKHTLWRDFIYFWGFTHHFHRCCSVLVYSCSSSYIFQEGR